MVRHDTNDNSWRIEDLEKEKLNINDYNKRMEDLLL